MIDKVQKIREEVERLKRWNNNVRDSTRHMTLQEEDFNRGKHSSYLEILNFIDSLQEEPVSEFLNTESTIESYKQRLISQANGVKNSPLIDMCLASYKHGINETLDTLNLSNAQRTVKNWKEPKFKVGDRIKFKGIHNEDVTRVITDIKEGEGVGFRYFFADGSIYAIGDDGIELAEEPVCEDLEEEIQKTIHNHFFDLNGIAIAGTSVYATVDDMVYIAKHFANWQKEQIMKDATEVTVHIDAGGYPYIPQMELYDYDKDVPLAKEGDRYKVILIKED